jgi:hypothetical protein
MSKRLSIVVCMLALSAASALAQSTYGTLLGTVKDATGAVVPDASIVVTEVTTNNNKTGVANARGDYEIPNLLPGSYEISVSAPGFKKFVRRGVLLEPRAEVRVDASLEVGATETAVEVMAAAPVITTETATVSDVEKSQELSQLPINFRGVSTTPLNAISTIPGIQVDSGGATGGNAISIAGNHPAQNEFTVDGFSVTSPRFNGPTTEMFPSTEQISEIKVTEQLAAAEYGQIGDVSFIGKSGTNQYHGSLFEYFQNDKLDAIPGFANGKPKKRANTFGGSIGGPVRLPKFNGKDHTFFFFDWEGNRQRSATPITDSVPTSAMRSGDLSALCGSYDSAGVCTDPKGSQLVNPFTGSPFPNNKIPNGMLNPVSQKVLSTYYPNPNSPNAGPLDVNNNFRFNAPQPITTNLYDIRIDQNLSSKQSLFGRWSWKRSTSTYPLDLNIPQDFGIDPKSFVVSHNYAIRPKLLNEFRFGFNSQTTSVTYPKFPDGAKLIADLGLQQLGPFPKGSAFPDFNFNGGSGVSSSPGARQEQLREHKYQFADNLTWIHGRHTMKYGFDIRELRSADYESFTAADNFGDYNFDGSFSGNDFADFLLGLPNYTAIVNAGPDFDGHARAYGFFGQDSVKLTQKLSVDFGVRYEYHPPFHDDSLQIAIFNRKTGGVVVPNDASLKLATTPFLQSINACGLSTPNPTPYGLYPCTPVQTAKQAGLPEALRIADKKKILPRLSFAYRLTDKTVIRAGAGLYDETLLGTIFYSLTGIHTSDYRAFINSFSNGQPAIQFPNTKSTSSTSGVGPAGQAVFGTSNQIDLHDPYAAQWSFTVEREIGAQTGLRVTYTGMRSIGLVISPDLNQIRPQTTPYDPREKQFPNWDAIKTRDNGGSALYNGLETVVSHRYSSGIFLQSSWIWSKNLSNGEGDNPNAGFTGENGPRVSNRFDLGADKGNVSYTRRHRWLTTATIDLPFGRGKRFGSNMSPVADAVLGGWRTTHILIFQTGPYLTPYYSGGNDPSGTNAPNRPGSQRPDLLPLSACDGLPTSDARTFGGSCFFYGWPGQIGRFGNSGVGILGGSGTALWSGGLSKTFPLHFTEQARLRFESTFTNLPNHVNFGQPSMKANSGSFGVISSVQNPEGASARTVQLAMRVEF